MIETKLSARGDRALRIGLIADTHVHAGQIAFPEAALAALRGVDQIVHLGDMGEASVLDRLAEVAPVVATRGGDDPAADARIADARLVVAGGATLAAAFELDVAERLLRDAHGRAIEAVAFAATHAPASFVRDGVLFVNPGSATLPASGPRTVAILELGSGGPSAVIVELAP
jgi:putative phosphoesterase